MATIKITNKLTKVMTSGAGADTNAFISPSGVTCPCTPIDEYISDMVTFIDGTLAIPAYNKVQIIQVPYGKYVEFEVTDYKEIAYYESLKLANATVEITDGITKDQA